MERGSGRMSLPYHVSITLRCLSHWALVAGRHARCLAELDTTELDEEITRRVLLQPQMWPAFFSVMERAGTVDDARREQQLDVERVEDERTDPNMET